MAVNYSALFTGALGFTIALAWNDAVRTAVHSVVPPTDTKGAARATFLYALLVTVLVIFVVAVINRARRLVHGSRGAAPPGSSPPRPGEGRKSGFAPAPLVRLWEPPAP